jgi:hypothetical protein
MRAKEIVAMGLLLLVVTAFSSPSEGTVNIVWMSDIHFDPYYNTASAEGRCREGTSDPMGSAGCDAPLALVRSATDDAKSLRPDYVVMSGDWMRHGMVDLPIADAVPTFNSVAQMLAGISAGVFPLPNVAGALGNNDFIPDYYFNDSAMTHPLLANITQVLRNHSLLGEAEATSFTRCAFYSRDVSNSSLTIVALNTLVWTSMLAPAAAPPSTDPCGQLGFLQAELETARIRQRRVLIVSHVPIGVNLFDVLREGLNTSEAVYFQNTFAVRYGGIVSNYSSLIVAQLFGHTHKFSFVADTLFGVPAFTAPSISPIFMNNPSYLLLTLDASSLDLIDLQLRFLAPNKTAWVDGQSLRSILNVPQLSVTDIRGSVRDQLLANQSMWDALVLAYGGGIPDAAFPLSPCDSYCRLVFSCSLREALLTNVAACVAASAPDGVPADAGNPGRRNIIIGSAAGAFVLLVFAVVLILWKKKRCRACNMGSEQLINATDES